MQRNLAETVMGAVVLIVAGLFLYFFITTAQIQTVQGYSVSARFGNIGGLQAGSDVRISGIAVGSVLDRSIDPETYEAVVSLSIRPDVKIPEDSVVGIGSGGFIGGPHVTIQPGKSPKFIGVDRELTNSLDFKALEEQVGEVIFLATGGNTGN